MTARVYPLREPAEFRRQNNANWAAITDFWLDATLVHVAHVGASLIATILGDTNHPRSILDMGCGNGWLREGLRAADWRGHYIGIDNNVLLIEALRQRSTDSDAEFHCEDVEATPRPETGRADVVVNAFNFFELPDLNAGFGWAAASLRPGGRLIIVTVDPLSQLLAICDTQDDLANALNLWSTSDALVAYDKTIDIEGSTASKTYSGILYGLSDYFRYAQRFGLHLIGLEEVRKTARRPPQVYDLIEFRDSR